MPNKNRFILQQGSSWELQADSATIGAEFGWSSTWEDLSVLTTELNDLDAAGGGILDLRGRQFAWSADQGKTPQVPIGLDQTNDITIKNGYISGAAIIADNQWTNDSGTYTAPFDLVGVPYTMDPQAYLIDPLAADVPLIATWPSSNGTEQEQVPRCVNRGVWFDIRSDGNEVNDVLTVDIDTGVPNLDNTVGGKIRGFRINDTAMKNEWDAKFASIALDGVSPSDLMLYVHCDANRVPPFRVKSWDSGTGVLMVTKDFTGTTDTYGDTYPGYARLCFVGAKNFIVADGEYSPDWGNNEIHYRPVEGSPAGVGYQACHFLFRSYNGGITTLENLELSGAASLHSSDYNRIVDAYDNTCHSFASGLSKCRNLADNDFNYWYDIAAGANTTGTQAIRIERNRLGPYGELRSGISVFGPKTAPSDMAEVTIKDNYCSLPYSTHGQGMSIYINSWQKATIEHNIFHNCARAFSYQPEGNGGEGNAGTYAFKNNLIVITDDFNISPGQTGYAFNGALTDYFLLGENPPQVIEIYSNSIIMTQEAFDENDYAGQATYMSVSKHRIGAKIANNIAHGINTAGPVPSNYGPFTDPHLHANNLQTRKLGLYPNGWAATDLPDLPDENVMSHLVSADSLEIAAPYNTAATDGGTIGIRWQSIPTVSELRNGLSKTWYLDHPALDVPVPSPTDLTPAIQGEENRPDP